MTRRASFRLRMCAANIKAALGRNQIHIVAIIAISNYHHCCYHHYRHQRKTMIIFPFRLPFPCPLLPSPSLAPASFQGFDSPGSSTDQVGSVAGAKRRTFLLVVSASRPPVSAILAVSASRLAASASQPPKSSVVVRFSWLCLRPDHQYQLYL